MRIIAVVLALIVSQLSWGNGQRQLEQLASQTHTLWQSYRPVCVMGLTAEQQMRVEPRLLFLESQLQSEQLLNSLKNVGAPVLSSVWAKPAWQRMALLESEALQSEQRENLREYLFKLQVNKPNKNRKALISQLQQTAQQLNLALREGLWKTCHGLAIEGMAPEQAEALLDARWQSQVKKVAPHLEQELNAFYFFSYRQISNEELQQFALLQDDIQPWTEAMTAGIDQHFAQLRQDLLAQAMPMIMNPESADEPFPSDRPWTQAPSQSPFQP